jgi:prophage regulatory protein
MKVEPPKVIRIDEVANRTATSRSTIYNRINPKSKYYDPRFPQPFRIGGGPNIGFLEDEVSRYILELANSRRGGK